MRENICATTNKAKSLPNKMSRIGKDLGCHLSCSVKIIGIIVSYENSPCLKQKISV